MTQEKINTVEKSTTEFCLRKTYKSRLLALKINSFKFSKKQCYLAHSRTKNMVENISVDGTLQLIVQNLFPKVPELVICIYHYQGYNNRSNTQSLKNSFYLSIKWAQKWTLLNRVVVGIDYEILYKLNITEEQLVKIYNLSQYGAYNKHLSYIITSIIFMLNE